MNSESANNTRESSRTLGILMPVGSLVLAVGAILFSLTCITYHAGWLIIVGGILSSLGCFVGAKESKKKSTRLRRLDRMVFIAMLIYIVSGGFMLEKSRSWLVLFTVATVLYLYAIFTIDRINRKRKQSNEYGE